MVNIDEAEDKIYETLTKLADEPGYQTNIRGLLSLPMFDLLPTQWLDIERAAGCDELIRQYVHRISPEHYAQATIAALDLYDEYKLPTQNERLIAFRRAWREAHPDTDSSQLDMTKDEYVYDATRKWWKRGQQRLARAISNEIDRRNETGNWPIPSQDSIERIQAACRPPDSADALTRNSAAQEEASPKKQGNRKHVYLAAIVGCLVVILGATLFVAAQPGQHAKGDTASYTTAIEHRYDGMDPQGKDGPESKCADPPPSQALDQEHPSVIGPSGKAVGYVELRTSPICQVLWAQVHWGKHEGYTLPPGWALHVQMIRRVHPKMIQFVAYDTSKYVYGNMLATVSGCVYAKVFFARGSQQTPPAITKCRISYLNELGVFDLAKSEYCGLAWSRAG